MEHYIAEYACYKYSAETLHATNMGYLLICFYSAIGPSRGLFVCFAFAFVLFLLCFSSVLFCFVLFSLEFSRTLKFGVNKLDHDGHLIQLYQLLSDQV